ELRAFLSKRLQRESRLSSPVGHGWRIRRFNLEWDSHSRTAIPRIFGEQSLKWRRHWMCIAVARRIIAATGSAFTIHPGSSRCCCHESPGTFRTLSLSADERGHAAHTSSHSWGGGTSRRGDCVLRRRRTTSTVCEDDRSSGSTSIVHPHASSRCAITIDTG